MSPFVTLLLTHLTEFIESKEAMNYHPTGELLQSIKA
jgi:hypothetical protein